MTNSTLSRKAILSLSALALSAFAVAAQAAPVKVGVAAEPYPPFSSPTSDGQWEGWEIDVINAMCTQASLECEITPIAWDGIIPALTSNQIDLIMSSMSITPERLEVIDFSDPYYQTPESLVTDKSMEIEPTPESLAGKVIGVQASTIHQTYAQAHFPDSEIKVYQTQDEANQDLAAGRIDATLADTIAMEDFVASDAGAACCKVVGNPPYDAEILGTGIGAGMRKGEDELKTAVNMAITTIKSDGTLAKITETHFGSDIFAGQE